MNETQINVIETVFEDYVSEVIEGGHAEWLFAVISKQKHSKAILHTVLSRDELSRYRTPESLTADFVTVIACITANQPIPDAIIDKLEGYRNYDLYNLASLRELKDRTHNLPQEIRSALYLMREACLAMTVITQVPPPSNLQYRLEGTPFNLENYGNAVTKSEIFDCAASFIDKKIHAYVMQNLGSITLRKVLSNTIIYINEGKINLAHKLLTIVIDSEEIGGEAFSDLLRQRIELSKRLEYTFDYIYEEYKKLLNSCPMNEMYRHEFISYCIEIGTPESLKNAYDILMSLSEDESDINVLILIINCYFKRNEAQVALDLCWRIIKYYDETSEIAEPLKEIYSTITKSVGISQSLRWIFDSNDFSADEKIVIYYHLTELFPNDISLICGKAVRLQTVEYKHIKEFLIALDLIATNINRELKQDELLKIITSLDIARENGINIQSALHRFYFRPDFNSDLLVQYANSLKNSSPETTEKKLFWLNLAVDKFDNTTALKHLADDYINRRNNILAGAQYYLRIKCAQKNSIQGMPHDQINGIKNCVKELLNTAHGLQKNNRIEEAYQHLQMAHVLMPSAEIKNDLALISQKLPDNKFINHVALAEKILLSVKDKYERDLNVNLHDKNFSDTKFKQARDMIAADIEKLIHQKILINNSYSIIRNVSALLSARGLFYRKKDGSEHVSINLDVAVNKDFSVQISKEICNNIIEIQH